MPPAAPAIPAAAPVAPAAPHRGAQPRDAGTTATLTPTVQPVPTPTDQPTATTGPGSANPTTPCFPAETLVATSHGLQAIQTLWVGQSVLSEDPATHNVEAEAMQAVIADPVSPLMAVQLSDGSAITVTADHPFWVDGGVLLRGAGWLAAGQLRPGDQLRTADGTNAIVVRLRYHVGYAVVYTLTVAKAHTFFVSPARVLVHNDNCPIVAWIRLEDLPPAEQRAVEEALERITGQRSPPIGRLARRFGAEFRNSESHLPLEPAGYYHEYAALLPGATQRGILRIVTGASAKSSSFV